MIKQVIFKKIKFNNFEDYDFKKIISKKGYFVFPAAPALASINLSKNYYDALLKADSVFFDSGFFVLLLKLIKGITVKKFSGYKFLSLFFDHLKNNKTTSILTIDPNKINSIANKKLLKEIGVKRVDSYIAPNYDQESLRDLKLLKRIKKTKPDFIITNIGGGIQEILGKYIKEKSNKKCTIVCTGGAIAFFTGKQAPINSLIDKLYLGWFLRLIFNPIIFIKRYISALKLIKMVLKDNIRIVKI